MKFNVDLYSGLLTNTAFPVVLKLGSNESIWVQFIRDGLQDDANGATVANLIIKRRNDFAGPIVAQCLGMENAVEGGAAILGLFTGMMLTASDALTEDFANNPLSLTYMGQIYWANGAGTPTLSVPFDIIIQNSIFRTGDGTATISFASSPIWMSSITGLTGGGSSNLDGVHTIGLPLNIVASTVIAGALGFYQLQAGAANVVGGDIAPLDYAAGTNSKKWVKIL